MKKCLGAFTLVELLMVIAIISVLAALLLPAIGNALYSARIVTCMNTLKQAHLGVSSYTFDYRGWYPTRPIGSIGIKHNHLRWGAGAADVRPLLTPYMSINSVMQCPFALEQVDLEKAGSNRVEGSYAMYFNFGHNINTYGYDGVRRKVGEKYGYFVPELKWPKREYTGVLMGDMENYAEDLSWSNHTHPTRQGQGGVSAMQDTSTLRFTRYVSNGARDPLDLNYIWEDGHAKTFTDICQIMHVRPKAGTFWSSSVHLPSADPRFMRVAYNGDAGTNPYIVSYVPLDD